eukprot:Em0001g1861a
MNASKGARARDRGVFCYPSTHNSLSRQTFRSPQLSRVASKPENVGVTHEHRRVVGGGSSTTSGAAGLVRQGNDGDIHGRTGPASSKLTGPVRAVAIPVAHLWAKLNTNSSSMSLQWNAPLQPDYVITAYTLHHRVPSLKSQSEMWEPPSTATVQFHTYNPSGILFYQINSVMTDFLGVKLQGGVPWLIFDVGSGPAVVGSNSTRTFNDGQWHTGYVVLFEQASNTFYVTVDTVHMAAIHRADMALQPLTACVLSPPEWYLAPDGFDAVSVQNVGSTYISVSWDLPTDSNGILINFSLYCNGTLAGVLPLTVISYNTGLLPFTLYMYITLPVGQVLQSRPQALHSVVEWASSVLQPACPGTVVYDGLGA